jgi:hypothetical protein
MISIHQNSDLTQLTGAFLLYESDACRTYAECRFVQVGYIPADL